LSRFALAALRFCAAAAFPLASVMAMSTGINLPICSTAAACLLPISVLSRPSSATICWYWILSSRASWGLAPRRSAASSFSV
jgi:hypothetical protein